jgi:hypothetical protein
MNMRKRKGKRKKRRLTVDVGLSYDTMNDSMAVDAEVY